MPHFRIERFQTNPEVIEADYYDVTTHFGDLTFWRDRKPIFCLSPKEWRSVRLLPNGVPEQNHLGQR